MAYWDAVAAEAGLPHHAADTLERVSSIAILILAIVGVCANSFAAYLFYRYERLRRQPSNILILFLCVGDGLLMCLPRTVEAPIAIVNDGYPAWYHPLCQLFGAMPLTSAYISVFTLSIVSLERYFAIVKRKAVTRNQAYSLAGGIWSAAFIIGTVLPIITAAGKGTPRTPYVLQSSGLYCLINWGDSSPAGRTQVAIAVTTLLIVVSTLVGGYFGIWWHVKTIAVVVSASPTPMTVTPSTDSQCTTSKGKGMKATMTAMEQSLMYKAVIISAVFLVNWFPYTILIAYEGLRSEHNAPKVFETIAYFGVEINAATNPFLFILLDTRVLACAKRVLGLHVDEPASDPSSAAASGAKDQSRRTSKAVEGPPWKGQPPGNALVAGTREVTDDEEQQVLEPSGQHD
ncbi:hypothetical protein HDU87_000474 [Geranomyces variabilis]|uniref:G-protein coupled receptors family 1 profile domain-containing protein n=1 Tax=Geranomyces variabilis TaxID=109894 RepID=A0AAD5XJJ0_9FUNG|nr:hypothetical protein HDU87_000474 [Geranomyces variabilis]